MSTFLIALLLCTSLNLHHSTNIDCKYGTYSFWSVGSKYECRVQNNPNINSPDKAIISNVTGTHAAGKTNNDEIYFHAESKIIEYFPQELDKIFPNLVGIRLFDTKLKGIQKSDLKPFTKLTYLCLNMQKIQVLENDLFDYNPNIEHVLFQNCGIVHIGLNVFDNLNNLKALYVGKNPCTGDYLNNTENDVKEIIRKSKIECKNSDFVALDSIYIHLSNQTKHLNGRNFPSFRRGFLVFQSVFNSSKFVDYWPLKEKVQNLGKLNFLDYFTINFSTTTTTGRPMISRLTTPEQIEDNITKSTTSCLECCQINDFKAEHQKNIKDLNDLVDDFKVSVTDSLARIGEKMDNVLSLVDAKIINLEEHLSAKIEQILKDKLDDVLKNMITND